MFAFLERFHFTTRRHSIAGYRVAFARKMIGLTRCSSDRQKLEGRRKAYSLVVSSAPFTWSYI